jgi:putative FmdB family regulatory protein
MPTYEYECKKCGERFERYQSITARPLTKCPACGGRVRRRIGAGGGVIFKGSGFYETDYKRKKVPPANGASDAENAGKDKISGKKDTRSTKKDS